MKPILVAAFALAATLAAAPSDACSPSQPDGFQVDAAAQLEDEVAPGEVAVEEQGASFYEGDGDCFAEHWRIEMVVSASDDVTPADELGYLVLDAGETPPERLAPNTYVERAFSGGLLREQRDAELEGEVEVMVYAVDAAGNVGPGTRVNVALDDDTGGCSVGGRGGASASWLLLAMGALGLSRRRRR